MPALRFDIISIGTLSRNVLWHESEPLRTPHATTTLIRAGKSNILVDPGLPAQIIGARLFERTGLKPQQIDTVFLTNFRPAHHGGLSAFTGAKVYLHEREQDAARARLEEIASQLPSDDEDYQRVQRELEILNATITAPDKIAKGVDLFPLFGYTPGTCGLLLAMPTLTALIAGDAVATQDHFLAGQVLNDPADLQAARESLQEIYDIADVIVPGHDNLFLNPRSAGL